MIETRPGPARGRHPARILFSRAAFLCASLVLFCACGPATDGDDDGVGALEAGDDSAADDAGIAESGGPEGPEASAGQCGGGSPTSTDLVVDPSDVHQRISGFGVSTAWNSSLQKPSDAELLWSTTTGAGLSLHRIRIDYRTGQTSELGIAQQAVAHGVTVWATPWTPPGAFKTGATGVNDSVGGTLSNGPAFAAFLAGFVANMRSQGVDIYAVSAQNEPDFSATYESCSYTPTSMSSFIGKYMGPALSGSGALVMAPETVNGFGFPSYESAILHDPSASQYTAIYASHEYGAQPPAAPELARAGKEYWETEISDTVTPADPGMASGLRVAALIHNAMTVASMNAWHYWWVYPASNDNAGLWDPASGQPSKRLWVEGNYSRFVRPGFVRVGTAGSAPIGVFVSAYLNPADSKIVVVAINTNATATPLSVFLSSVGPDGSAAGGAPCSMAPWVTSSSANLSAKHAVSVAGSRFSYSLAAQSVTTFVSSSDPVTGGQGDDDAGSDAASSGGDAGGDAASIGTGGDSAADASQGDDGATRDATVDGPSEAAPEGGPADESGAGGDDAGPTGCAELTVPLSEGGGATHFIIDLPPLVDFTGATVTADIYAPGATGGALQAYLQQGSGGDYAENLLGGVPLTSASSWTTFSWTVGGSPTSGIQRLGFSVEPDALAGASVSFEQPATTVYVGRVSVSSSSPAIGPFPLDTPSSVGPATPMYPPDVLWMNTDDPYVSGSSVVWNPFCARPSSVDTNAPDAASDPPTDATNIDMDASVDDVSSETAEVSSDPAPDATSNATPDATTSAAEPQGAACPPGLAAGTGGCAVLTVPLSGSGQSAHYVLALSPTVDLTGATIDALVIAPQATAGVLQAFVQDGSVGSYAASFLGWQNLTGASAWTTLSWTVPSAFDATAVARIGLSVESGSVSASTTFEQPDTFVYVASIAVTLPPNAAATVGPFPFGAASTVQAAATPTYPTGVLWLNVDDGPVGGSGGGPGSSSLGWLPQ